MNCNDFMEAVTGSDFVFAELPMQIQLGMPRLKKNGERVSLVFSPHREVYRDGKIDVYASSYELETAYPSGHIISFVDKTYEHGDKAAKPIRSFDAEWAAVSGRQITESVLSICKDALRFYDEYNKLPDPVIKQYNEKLINAAEELGLLELYGVD